MAVIAQQNGVSGATAPVTLTPTTMTASDTFTGYSAGSLQRLMLVNNTGAQITVTLAGSAGTPSVQVTGVGSVTATGGKAVPVAANSFVHLSLDNYSAWLAGNGTVTLTGGTGLLAALYV